MKPVVISFLAAFCFLTSFLNGQTLDSNYLDGEIYVKYHDYYPIDFSKEFVEPHTLPGLDEGLVAKFGIVQTRFSFNKCDYIPLLKTVRIKFSFIDKADELIHHFEKLPFIDYAEKIPAYRPTYTPNDLGIYQWSLYKIKAQGAWDYTKGDTTIKVAVVDQEFDINHPDLKNNVWKNPGEIPGNGLDDDKNGYIDDVNGWDAADNDNNVICNTNSLLNHGTPCAGIVASATNNGVGNASIGFNLKFIPIKVSKDAATTNVLTNSYDGILYAAKAGANIISCSFGSGSYSQTAQYITDYARGKNCIVVAAAGNNDNSTPHYPANYNGVISVAATDVDDKKASFSTYGNWIDISAPGVSIITTMNSSKYTTTFSGTSAACPLTAGLLGLMKSHYLGISNSALEKCLINSADNIYAINSGYSGKLGSGRINAEKALKCVDSVKTAPPKLMVGISASNICPNKNITLSAKAVNNDVDSIIWYLPGSSNSIATGTVVNIKYPKDSLYSISVVGFNKYGKDSVFLQDFINVNSIYDYTIFSDYFEDNNAFFKYEIENSDTIVWKIDTAKTTSAPANQAFTLDLFSSGVGQRDAFILPALDFSTILKPRLFFQHAFVTSINGGYDSLNVYASVDSGKTYLYKILSVTGSTLITSFNSQITVTTLSNNDWCFISNRCFNTAMDSLAGKKNVVLKFESYHDIGHNLFIDNIKVYSLCIDVISSKPKSGFSVSDTILCAGDSLGFTDKSTSYPRAYQWLFPGGKPVASALQNPVVTYDSAGIYDVTLITTNPIGSDTLIMPHYVRVAAIPKLVLPDTQKYVCAGDSIHFIASGADSILWYKPGLPKPLYGNTFTDKPVQTTFYPIKGITREGCSDSASVKAVYVLPPAAPTIIQKADSLEAQHQPGNYIYKWYLNDTLAAGLTQKTTKPTKTGSYKVTITDSAGCSVQSATYFYVHTGVKKIIGNAIHIYPNPAKNTLFIGGLETDAIAKAFITDITGRQMLETAIEANGIDISTLQPGIYIITINQNGWNTVRKVRVE